MNQPRELIATQITVRWGDMDAFNHVNNAKYATYVEEARLRWFSTFDGGWHDENIGPVVAAQSINYRLPIEWPAEVVVELSLERAGNSSLTLGIGIVSADMPRRFYADGSTVLVWIDRRTGKSTALPAPVRRAVGIT